MMICTQAGILSMRKTIAATENSNEYTYIMPLVDRYCCQGLRFFLAISFRARYRRTSFQSSVSRRYTASGVTMTSSGTSYGSGENAHRHSSNDRPIENTPFFRYRS